MKRTLVLGIVLATLLVVGCGAAEPEALGLDTQERVVTEAEGAAGAREPVLSEEVSESFEPTLTERLIIRNASMELVVADTEAAVAQVNGLVDELGGFVVSSQLRKFDEGVRASMTVRVPAEALDDALARLRDMTQEVRRQTTSSQEVTEEYTDLQAQLRHLEATEARLLTFLDQAEDTEATLSVFRELQNVQREIERIKGRIQFLEDAAALSTINLELVPDTLASPISIGGWRPQGTLRNAFEALVRAAQFVVDAFIWIVVFALPVALVVFGVPGAVLFWVVRRFRRRRE